MTSTNIFLFHVQKEHCCFGSLFASPQAPLSPYSADVIYGDPLAQRERGGSLFLERRTKELLISLISLSPIFPFLHVAWQGSLLPSRDFVQGPFSSQRCSKDSQGEREDDEQL